MIYMGINVAKDKHGCKIITKENKSVPPMFVKLSSTVGFMSIQL